MMVCSESPALTKPFARDLSASKALADFCLAAGPVFLMPISKRQSPRISPCTVRCIALPCFFCSTVPTTMCTLDDNFSPTFRGDGWWRMVLAAFYSSSIVYFLCSLTSDSDFEATKSRKISAHGVFCRCHRPYAYLENENFRLYSSGGVKHNFKQRCWHFLFQANIILCSSTSDSDFEATKSPKISAYGVCLAVFMGLLNGSLMVPLQFYSDQQELEPSDPESVGCALPRARDLMTA